MSEVTTQEVSKDVIATGKTVISFKSPTPAWATWLFRGVYIFVTALAWWLAATKLVPEANKFEILLIATTTDRIMWLAARAIGVKKEDITGGES